MKKYTHLNSAEFDKIKQLQNAGLTQKEIALFVKRSSATLSHILKSETYEAYRTYIRTLALRYKTQRAVAEQVQDESAPSTRVITKDDLHRSDDWFASMLEEARTTNKLLAELVNTKQLHKKGWFK